MDLTYLDVKQEFKLNPKATFKQAKNEIMNTISNIRSSNNNSLMETRAGMKSFPLQASIPQGLSG